MDIQFRRAGISDIPAIRALIQKRIDWMNETGIHQWNETDYLTVYDEQYFEKNIDSFYLAFDGERPVGAVAFYEQDDRWPDHKRAIYVHHLTSAENGHEIGKQLMQLAERVAAERNISTVRLDSEENNGKLKEYYSSLGYREYDRFTDGAYRGIRLEKTLKWKIRHIFDGDYGCEALAPGEKPKVSVTLVNENGEELIKSVEDDWLKENGLDVGSEWPLSGASGCDDIISGKA